MKGILVYLLLAFGGAWLMALPLWISGQGLQTPHATALMVGMMLTPTVAALIASRISPSPEGFLRASGLHAARPFRRWWRYALVAWLAPIAVIIAALALAAALGLFHADLVNFSGFAEQVHTALRGIPLPIPVRTLVLIQLGSVLLAGFINAIPALGEELGWRGFLLLRLCRFGQWPAVLLTGVAWGLWHAPIILLGYNYPGLSPIAALACMVVFCTLLSVLFGWLRLASSSIWPPAIAHGFVNAGAGLGILLSTAGQPVDNATTGLLGWTGWIVLATLIAALVAMRRFPVRPPAFPTTRVPDQ